MTTTGNPRVSATAQGWPIGSAAMIHHQLTAHHQRANGAFKNTDGYGYTVYATAYDAMLCWVALTPSAPPSSSASPPTAPVRPSCASPLPASSPTTSPSRSAYDLRGSLDG